MSASTEPRPPALAMAVLCAAALAAVVWAYADGTVSAALAFMLTSIVCGLLLLTLLECALSIKRYTRRVDALLARPMSEAVRQQLELLSVLREVALLAATEADRREAAVEIVRVLSTFFGTRRLALCIERTADRPGEVLALGLTSKVHTGRKARLRPAEEDALKEARRDRRVITRRVRGGHLLVYPFGGRDGASGAVVALLPPRSDPARTLDTLRHLIRPISIALRVPTLYERAVYDGLTRLFTRRHLDSQLPAICTESARLRSALSVLMLDIDHFKRVNDTHGHLIGDAVLKSVAAVVRRALREYDAAYRYGGEEFCVVLPHTDSSAAIKIARRIHAAVAAEPVETDDGVLSVTVSMGVATAEDGWNPKSLMDRADAALYEAKRTGRNRIVVAA